jgi:hypothetical protein
MGVKSSKSECISNYDLHEDCPKWTQEECSSKYPTSECEACAINRFDFMPKDLGAAVNDLGSVAGLTLEEAAQKCLDTEGCVGFTTKYGALKQMKNTREHREDGNTSDFLSFVLKDNVLESYQHHQGGICLTRWLCIIGIVALVFLLINRRRR